MDYKGKVALITGASSGIGLEYAREFARRGSDLILVARREDALKKLATELKASGVKVDYFALDLSELASGEKLATLLAKAKLSPDFLVNNAGFGTNARLQNEDRLRLQHQIVLNIATLVDLTAALLPAMLKRDSGAIINIASTAAYQPVPGMAVYAATKAFVLSFTSALWGEVQGTKVRVLTVSPGATATEFFDVAGAKPFGNLAPVKSVIETTFKALDAKKSRPAVVVGGQNRLMASATKFLPKAAVIKVAASMFLK